MTRRPSGFSLSIVFQVADQLRSYDTISQMPYIITTLSMMLKDNGRCVNASRNESQQRFSGLFLCQQTQ